MEPVGSARSIGKIMRIGCTDCSVTSTVGKRSASCAGVLSALDAIPVHTSGTPFQCEVWAALRAIPAGQTLSYGALAQAIGRPAAIRAVGHANGANPLSVVVPCHRLIGASGSLTGYGGGLERKRWLLAHEGVSLAPSSSTTARTLATAAAHRNGVRAASIQGGTP